ncbi:DCC1-like thiol-disulfide oxidoreductase family protein [Streptomyces sp. NPDC097619]|uniref:thiol-disulfide oxidoreductase DCC family protein n=1 Tax=Streptomyces sp. NPDC097619 TaxID=3157228 RepID=UPI00332A826B
MAAPVRRLTVLYDAGCPLCVHLRHWLLGQKWLVPLSLVPAGSEEARRRFPALDHADTLREITVIGDGGQVYRGTDAFIVALWALAEHRPKAHWLATPAGAPFARATMLAAAKWRELSRSDEPAPAAGVAAGTVPAPAAGTGCADGACAAPVPPG